MRKIIIILTIILLIIQTTGTISINQIKWEYEVKTQNEFLDNHESGDHQWPMYKHDIRRTGLSEYDTSQNPGFEKWKYFYEWSSTSTAVIDKDGNLYVPTLIKLHSAASNGIKKWEHDLNGHHGYVPAIGPDGTIYVGTHSFFHAFNPDGSLKWILDKGEKSYRGYPVIDSNGIIYTGTTDGYLYAIYPNGTVKWEYSVANGVLEPALDSEGNIYFTENSKYLYCLDSNGSLQWRYEGITNFYDGPVIGEDGTIFVVPVHYLIAINPNGTEKWKIKFSDWAGKPSIAPDGTLIISGESEYVTAVNPDDGNILWQYLICNSLRDITGSAISSDGTIFVAYVEYYPPFKGYMCAISSDGYLKWSTRLTSDIKPYDGMDILSDPSIGSDGTIYITTWFYGGGTNRGDWGYLHAINKLDSNAPEKPSIIGKKFGKVGGEYQYIFKTISPKGNNVYYFIDWGDNTVENWIGPYSSGEEVIVNHTWGRWGIFKIQARARDADNLWGPWSEFKVTMPRNQYTADNMILRFLANYIRLFPILRQFLQL